ncbi:hypothetical protein IU433_21020 [Nocardia puris]|uniref:DUF7144 domain-containing protein n=1 Tax=Nocardia puris TaxID=208602 RepID=A0A366DBI5_9NOCA|nr:hypothetical protein [Nocardia puris]MBF6214108.1 hypothetical protein [Nocardia puris]MBF6368608.1 hypothetical protein [Nocardia puris]MBF6461510.1 hypothetical protein [Nocardia puris]RBO86618.1 hypothetical protein DFR74_113161 [Nocardia puris]
MQMTTPQTQHPVRQGIAAGTSIGAAILLLTVGVLQIFEGISAVAEDELFVVGPEYVYQFDVTAWGWIHIVLGAVLVVCALGLMTGTTWGKVAAVIIAALSIVANFLWLPYYPYWSLLIIALNIVVIWAVSTWRTDAT